MPKITNVIWGSCRGLLSDILSAADNGLACGRPDERKPPVKRPASRGEGPKTHSWALSPMTEDLGPSTAAVKSAARAFRVIEFFDEIRRAARSNEISERLGYPQSSTSVLLNSLVRLGYLDFDATSRTYLPSIRTAVLSTWRDTGCFRDGSMHATLELLSETTGLAACLTVRNDIFTRYLHVVQTIEAGAFHVTLAARRYAVKSAAGIVLLAHLTDREIAAIVHRTRAVDDPSLGSLALSEVMDRIAAARADGYFVSTGLVTPQTGAVALALPPSVTGGWQGMALSLAGQKSLIEDRTETLADALTSAVGNLTAANRQEDAP